jgi:hypothetical protein
LIIHSNCTTGIEAVLAKRPVLNLLPANAARTDLDLEVAREAGIVATSIPDALEKIEAILADRVPAHAWSARAKSILNNLTVEAIPTMVRETLRVLDEKRISSSEAILPPERPLRSAIKRLAGRTGMNAYVATKRGSLDADYVEAVIAGCRANKVGSGSIRRLSEHFVVVGPQ